MTQKGDRVLQIGKGQSWGREERGRRGKEQKTTPHDMYNHHILQTHTNKKIYLECVLIHFTYNVECSNSVFVTLSSSVLIFTFNFYTC